MKPKLSVIVPVYNVEKYLRQCMDSVVNQTLKEIEIICINDGSPDSCGAILDEYAKKDLRVKPIHQENQGYGKTVNAGMEKATGKYIVIIETDDYIEKDMFSLLYETAEKYDANVVKAGFNKLYSNGDVVYIKPPFPFYEHTLKIEPKYSNDLMVMESSIWAALYKKEFLEKNDIKMLETKGAAYQDSVFKFMVYASTDFVFCIDKPVYNYRVMTANSSSKSTKNWDAMFKNYSVLKDWLLTHNKFEGFKSSYFLHGYFDFIFHFNRLSDDTKPLFLEKAKEFYTEGIKNGIGNDNARFSSWDIRNYYSSTVQPFLKRLEIKREKPEEKINLPRPESHAKAKKIIRMVYSTRLGKKLWDKFNSLIHLPFFWNKLSENVAGDTTVQSINILQTMDIPNNMIELDPPDEKNILVFLPWYLQNGACHYVENILGKVKEIGYKLHLFMYWNNFAPKEVNRKVWDRVFYKHCDNPYFSHTNTHENMVDNDHIDDWLDDDFFQCIIRLNNHYKYKICFANYLFYTKAFEVLPNDCRKIVCTHDKFLKHNQSLRDAGFPEWSFWFGLRTEEEEAKALLRSDLVLAIQEEDASYFRKITSNNVNVVTYPSIPEKRLLNLKNEFSENELTVGYVASDNSPNYFALLKMVENLKGSKVRLFVAGSICDIMIDRNIFWENCVVLGRLPSLDDFYSSYDLYINPDTFYSGFKCKTIEAMAFGVGIVCTKVAATGLDLDAEYHNFLDEKECCEYLKKISNFRKEELVKLLAEMKQESECKYDAFVEKYPVDKLTDKIIGV